MPNVEGTFATVVIVSDIVVARGADDAPAVIAGTTSYSVLDEQVQSLKSSSGLVDD
ncbi:MAG: hypothetical protein P4L10_07685 [Acidobacteriaceae bacterium]|nr:hypothetical protein [Acidobacteriaceae bacterium]